MTEPNTINLPDPIDPDLIRRDRDTAAKAEQLITVHDVDAVHGWKDNEIARLTRERDAAIKAIGEEARLRGQAEADNAALLKAAQELTFFSFDDDDSDVKEAVEHLRIIVDRDHAGYELLAELETLRARVEELESENEIYRVGLNGNDELFKFQRSKILKIEEQLAASERGRIAEHETILNLIEGCHDYGGGHRGSEYEAFHHGMDTVMTVVKHYFDQGLDDMQIRVVESVGANMRKAIAAQPQPDAERKEP